MSHGHVRSADCLAHTSPAFLDLLTGLGRVYARRHGQLTAKTLRATDFEG
jgi:hypothetical protein